MTTTRAAFVTAVATAAVYLAIPNAANALTFVGPTSQLWQGSQSQPQYYWGFDYSTYAEITSVDHERGSFRIEVTGDAYAPFCCSTTPGDFYAFLYSILMIFDARLGSLQVELIETRGLDNAYYTDEPPHMWGVSNYFEPTENVSWYAGIEVTLLDPSVDYFFQFGVGHVGGYVGGNGGGGGTVITPSWGFIVIAPVCGDGVFDPSEACDDGNLASGDGCSDLCEVEAGFTCAGEPSACTPLAPSIEVTPRQYDFGQVDLGTNSAQIVTISNMGDAPLVVDGVALLTGSGVGFELTDAPPVPFEIEPNATVDIGLLFTPVAGGAASATLRVTSNDPEEPVIEVPLTGSGVSYDAQAMALLSFFDGLVASGDLVGEGPGHSASGRLDALRNMIEASGDLIDQGQKAAACKQLQNARLRTDGLFPPPDFASGAAAPELEAEIAQLRSNLRCDVPRGGGGCGLGAELTLVMPLLGLAASRRRRAN